MRLPWRTRTRRQDPMVIAMREEADQIQRGIEATEPILQEALRRGEESAERAKRARESLEEALVRVIRHGLNDDG